MTVALLMHYRNRHVYLYHKECLTKATTKQNIAMPANNNVTTLTQSNSETTTSISLSFLSFSLFFRHSSVAYDHFQVVLGTTGSWTVMVLVVTTVLVNVVARISSVTVTVMVAFAMVAVMVTVDHFRTHD